MTLLVLCRVISNLAIGVVHREHVLGGIELAVDLCQPRTRCRPVKDIYSVFAGGAVPRLGRIHRHRLWPLLNGGIGHQGRYGHPCPHRSSMHIRVVVVVGFSASKDDLKAQTAAWHRGDCYRHRMKKLTVIFLVVVRVFTPHPAFKVRDVTL